MTSRFALAVSAIALLSSCTVSETTAPAPVQPDVVAEDAAPAEQATLLPYESFTLGNGLTVLFHVDRSRSI
ncbi:MAG: hypothetical protein AAGJ51_10570, partial [Pseudomonadota bacterium]